MDALRRELQQLRKYPFLTPSTTIDFVPEADLRSLLTKERLSKALTDPAFGLQAHQIEPVADETFETAWKVFAILVELRLEVKLKACLEKSVTDASLPVRESDRLLILFPESWLHFQRLQWEYVPVKLRERLHKDVDATQILPFIENKSLKSGGFSNVFKVKIHPKYQNWASSHDSTGVLAVRKEISSRMSDEAQRRESDLLFLLRSLRNDNIVQILTSYTQNGCCNLLFPVADYDLHDLLLNPERPGWVTDPPQLFHALVGLANGLDHLHNFRLSTESGSEIDNITKHGYHHDIKPRNVLVSGSRLILSDFGLSRLKEFDEDTKTLWKNTPPTYGAPEARDPDSLLARQVGRAYDIWSFGCVLSEVATYALEGEAGVRLFRQERIVEGKYGSHNCFHHDGEVSSEVLAWFSGLGSRCERNPPSRLLRLSRSLLQGNPDSRPKSKKVVRDLIYNSLKQLVVDGLQVISQVQNGWQDQTGLNTFLAKMVIEENRLKAWGHTLGLLAFDSHSKSITDHLDHDYKQRSEVLTSLIAQFAVLSRDVDYELDSRQSALRILNEANDSLLINLPDHSKISIDNTFQLMMVSDVRASTAPSAIDEDIIESNDHRDITAAHLRNALEHETRLLVAARYMAIMLSSRDNESLKQMANVIDPLLITSDPSHPSAYGSLSIRRYHRSFQATAFQRVLVEEKPYAGKWAASPNDREVADVGSELFRRVHELAILFQMHAKPETFRTLDCLGVYHMPGTAVFGFVYDFPQGTEPARPVTLSQFISDTKLPDQSPTLNDKFRLAKNLTSCISSLHMTGWLHKSITSHSFVYFNSAGQALTEVDMTEPYLTGFEHSRQSTQDAYSEGLIWETSGATIFTHPSYSKDQRYHPAFEYYSLGLILLEIALWRPLAKILEPKSKGSSVSSRALRHALKYVPQRMGTGYTEAILACLDFHEKHGDTDDATRLLLNFHEEVLEKLQRTSLPT